MTIRHLRVFLAVYRAQNVTHAAAQLNLTQPAVTRTVQELEHYYGVQLFERLNRRLVPTQAGVQLYAQAVQLVGSFDALELNLRNADGAGVLRVGGSITIGSYVLPAAARQFAARYPQMRLQVQVAGGGVLQKLLLENELDLAFIEAAACEAPLVAEPFGGDTMVLLVPPGHALAARPRVTLADAAAYPLLMRDRGSAGRDYLEHVFAAHGLTLAPLWESASTRALLQAVAAGVGVSILPRRLAARDVRAGAVTALPVADEAFARTYAVVRHKDKFLTPAAQCLIGLCRAVAREDAREESRGTENE